MDQLLENYIQYYRARMKRYEDNPNYPNSFASEKALYEAIASCEKLEDFRQKEQDGNLAVKNAIGLVKDQATAENKHYNDLKEAIRAGASQEILQNINRAQTALEVTSMVSNIETKWIKAITIDEFTNSFYDSHLLHLENIEVHRTAEVPDEWKREMHDAANDDLERFKEVIEFERKNNDAWQHGWTLDTNLLWEERHRRKIPLPDESLKRRISEYKSLTR